jgi:hypothetical protein
MTSANLVILKAFWDSVEGGMKSLWFYNVFEGSYDSSGDSTLGRYTVVFRNDWSQSTALGSLSTVPNLELVEVA